MCLLTFVLMKYKPMIVMVHKSGVSRCVLSPEFPDVCLLREYLYRVYIFLTALENQCAFIKADIDILHSKNLYTHAISRHTIMNHAVKSQHDGDVTFESLIL